MTAHALGRIALSFTALSLVAGLQCSTYDDSLLGHGVLAAGGAGATGDLGGNTAVSGGGSGGFGGELEAESGAANAGLGGLEEAAGAFDTGGAAEARGGMGGALGTGGANSGMGGALAGTSGTSANVGGSSGSSGTGGQAVPTASGCAKLTVPLDESSDKAHFVISLASSVDLSGATISMRFYVQAGQDGTLFNYVQDSGTYHFLGVPAAKRQSLSGANGWSTVAWNVGAEPDAAGTGIVKNSIKSIGIELNAQPGSTWSNPTIVFIDAINVTSPTLSFTFDAASSVATSNTNGALWLNNNSQDTTATNCTVTWQASCP